MKSPKNQRRLKIAFSSPSNSAVQVGLINQAGHHNAQSIDLSAHKLHLSQARCEHLEHQLALSQALVASQAQTIELLRATHILPS